MNPFLRYESLRARAKHHGRTNNGEEWEFEHAFLNSEHEQRHTLLTYPGDYGLADSWAFGIERETSATFAVITPLVDRGRGSAGDTKAASIRSAAVVLTVVGRNGGLGLHYETENIAGLGDKINTDNSTRRQGLGT